MTARQCCVGLVVRVDGHIRHLHVCRAKWWTPWLRMKAER